MRSSIEQRLAAVGGGSNAAVQSASRAHAFWAAGAVASLAALAGLTFSASPANAAFPGLNGKIACGGPLATELPDPLPAGQSRLEIFDINRDATAERRLIQDTASDASPRYSADGRKIVFNKNNQIWTMNADGSNQQGPLTSNTEGSNTNVSNTAGHWSPDGSQIVFQTTRNASPAPGFSFDVYKMNADGSNQTRLTADPTEDSLPAWSPDGAKIVFNSRRGGSPDLWTINASDGSNPTQLTSFPGEEAAAQWSPDGRQLVFHSDLLQVPGLPRNLEIYRTNADGSGAPTRLTFSDFSATGSLRTISRALTSSPPGRPRGTRSSSTAPARRSSGTPASGAPTSGSSRPTGSTPSGVRGPQAVRPSA